MQALQQVKFVPADGLSVIGAACTLDAADVPARVAEWTGLRGRAAAVMRIPGGVSLVLGKDEELSSVIDLVARESECCAFYAFTLRIEGTARELQVSAGEGREAAVDALLGL